MVIESVRSVSDLLNVLALDQTPQALAATLVNLLMLVLTVSGWQRSKSDQGVISISILRSRNDDSFDVIVLSSTRRIQFMAPDRTFTGYLIIDSDIWVVLGNDFNDPAKKIVF